MPTASSTTPTTTSRSTATTRTPASRRRWRCDRAGLGAVGERGHRPRRHAAVAPPGGPEALPHADGGRDRPHGTPHVGVAAAAVPAAAGPAQRRAVVHAAGRRRDVPGPAGGAGRG